MSFFWNGNSLSEPWKACSLYVKAEALEEVITSATDRPPDPWQGGGTCKTVPSTQTHQSLHLTL